MAERDMPDANDGALARAEAGNDLLRDPNACRILAGRQDSGAKSHAGQPPCVVIV